MTDDDFDLKTVEDKPSSTVAPVSQAVPPGVSADALGEFPVAIEPLSPPPTPDPSAAAPAIAPGDALAEFPVAIAPLTLTLATPPAPGTADRLDEYEPRTTGSGSSRTAMWPVAAALLVGLACGFGGGYLVGGGLGPFGQVQQRPAATVTPPTAQPGATALPGRNDTEGAINGSPGNSRPARADAGGRAGRVQPQPGPTDSSGRLVVRSTPAGAQIFVDGREVGRTPATIRGLARGAHRLRIVRDGYLVEDRPFVITVERPAQSVAVNLKRLNAAGASAGRSGAPQPVAETTIVGALEVESRPPDAQLYLDGTLVGTTPFALERIGAGQHSIRLERDGYRRWVASVWIVRGERSRITASLEQ